MMPVMILVSVRFQFRCGFGLGTVLVRFGLIMVLVLVMAVVAGRVFCCVVGISATEQGGSMHNGSHAIGYSTNIGMNWQVGRQGPGRDKWWCRQADQDQYG
jgi:hypothetical protein